MADAASPPAFSGPCDRPLPRDWCRPSRPGALWEHLAGGHESCRAETASRCQPRSPSPAMPQLPAPWAGSPGMPETAASRRPSARPARASCRVRLGRGVRRCAHRLLLPVSRAPARPVAGHQFGALDKRKKDGTTRRAGTRTQTWRENGTTCYSHAVAPLTEHENQSSLVEPGPSGCPRRLAASRGLPLILARA